MGELKAGVCKDKGWGVLVCFSVQFVVFDTIVKTDDSNSENTLYIHWKYHPGDIGNRHIREIYNNTPRNNDGFQHMRLAVSRPKYLRHLLCKTELPTNPGQDEPDIQKTL